MSDERLTRQLYLALKAMPCRCAYERNAQGVPLWTKESGGKLTRRLIQQCSRCQAVDEYEARYANAC